MSLAPELLSFGDGDHDYGATGLTVDGGGFGAFPGELWMFANADRSGAADQLTIGAWNDLQLTGVEIPASPNNAAGTVYLALLREDLAWSPSFGFTLADPSAASTALTGTALSGLLEQGLVDGALTIIATLTNEVWAADDGTFAAQRANIRDGLVSAQSEANGWNALRSTIPVSAVVRTSDTVVTITLPALPSYDISANETITFTIPATSVVGGQAIVATPTITVQAEAQTRMVTVFTTDPVPATAVFMGGAAYAQNGARYVCALPANPVFLGGIAHRQDGAMCIEVDGTIRTHVGGWAVTDDGEVVAATGAPAVFHGGIGLLQNGSVCMTEVN